LEKFSILRFNVQSIFYTQDNVNNEIKLLDRQKTYFSKTYTFVPQTTLTIQTYKSRNIFYFIGPLWLPLLGCFLTFRWLRFKYGYIYLAFQELARTYGPVLGLKLGNQKVVVISTHDLVKKALLQPEFNGRPDGFFFRIRSFGKRKGTYK